MKTKRILPLILAMLLIVSTFTGVAAQSGIPEGFVYLDEILVNATYEVRYYTENNFTGTKVNGYLVPRVILSQKAAAALAFVEQDLAKMGFAFKIFDGYRPQQAVDHFQRWAEDLTDTKMKKEYYPEVAKEDLFKLGYISAKSGHSRGSTVDLTLVKLKTGQELDMGGSFDFFGEISHHGTKLISKKQTKNRDILKNVMLKYGFNLYPEEWWHYTLADEPYPDQYFNFPVQ